MESRYGDYVMTELKRESASRESVDLILAALLSRGETVDEAAKFVGVAVRTVYRRLATTEFKVLMAEFRQVMFAAVAGRLSDAFPEATETLRSLLKHDDPNIQYKAAVKLIELAMKARDHAELDRDIKEVEVIMSGSKELPQQTCDAQSLPQPQDQ
jgi:hypothetical protein